MVFSGRSHLARRCDDFDPVDNVTYALHARGELLGDLLEVVGSQAAVQVEHVVTGEARNVAERQIAAPRSRSSAFRSIAGRRVLAVSRSALGSASRRMLPSPESRDGEAISDTWDAAAITAGIWAGTDQVSGVRSSDSGRARRKQKPRSREIRRTGPP